jgi:hypothetical protein
MAKKRHRPPKMPKFKFKDFTNGLSDFGKALASPTTSIIGALKPAPGSLALPLLIGGGVLVVFLLKK